MSFSDFDRVWFLTWTTYGSWLPGDPRGFVSNKFEDLIVEGRNNTYGTECDRGRPRLETMAKSLLKCPPIVLDIAHAKLLQPQFAETATFRGWTIVNGAIMDNHIHLLVGSPGDPDPELFLRDFKSYGSRALNKAYPKPASGTWWTEGGSRRKVNDEGHFENVRRYILNQHNPLLVW